MKLLSFRIKKFKSIIDTGECNLSESDNILVLAGQNEAGKSAVIEALNLFRNGPSPDFERLHKRQDDYPEVYCKFKLDNDDLDKILNATKNEKLKNYLQRNSILEFVRGKNDSKDIKDLEKIYLNENTKEELKKFFVG